MYSTSKTSKGDIAASLAIFTMVIITVGVLLGATLVGQSTPQRESEAQSFAVTGVTSTMPSNPDLAVDYTRLDRTRSINPDHAVLYGTLCFNDQPPTNGRYQMDVFLVKNDNSEVDVGNSIATNTSGPEFRCSAGRPDNFAAVFIKLPEGVTYDDVKEYHVRPAFTNISGTVPGTGETIAIISKDAVISAGGGSGSGATATPTVQATNTPTPTFSLPPGDKCWAACQTNVTFNFSLGDTDSCGAGYTCTNTSGLAVTCDAPNSNCHCLPTGKEACRNFECACAERNMCHERTVVTGSISVTGDIPKDASGNPGRFLVKVCNTVKDQNGNTECSSTILQTTFTDPNSKQFALPGLPQTKDSQNTDEPMGIFVDPAIYESNSNTKIKDLPSSTKIEIDNCTSDRPGITVSKSADNEVCFVTVTNASALEESSCRLDNVTYKTALPTNTPTPTATLTPSPTPLSERDRTVILKDIEIANHTKCRPGANPDCSLPGLDLKGRLKVNICSLERNGTSYRTISCRESVASDEFSNLIPGTLSRTDTTNHHLSVELPSYVYDVNADAIGIRACEVELDAQTDVPCGDADLNIPKGDDVVNAHMYIDIRLDGNSPKGSSFIESDADRSDVSGNSCINVDDYSRLILVYGKSEDEARQEEAQNPSFGGGNDPLHEVLPEDINRDGIVNAFDLAILLSRLGQGDNCAFNRVTQ